MNREPNQPLDIPPEIQTLWDEMDGPIVKYGHPALVQVARPVDKPGAATRELVDRMKAAMEEWRGIGLAAPQLGVSERVIIYRIPEEGEPIRIVINPKIVSTKGEQLGPEGCLSIPRLQGEVNRAMEVIVK